MNRLKSYMQRLSCVGWVALIAVFTSQIAVSGTALSAEIAIAAASDLNFAIKDIIV